MATWQEGSGAGFLAGIGRQNDNAPNAGDNALSLDLIRQNNDIQRSGANNVGLQALQGLAGFADTVRQADLAKATQQFNQVHANAWATGDNSGLVKFAQQNPAFVAQAQQAVSGLDAQQKQELGSLAMQTNTALSQGPQAYSQFINANSDRLKRVGADPNWMLQTGINNPQQLSHLTTTMALGAVGPEKMFDVQDKIVGREVTMRGQDIGQQTAAQNNAVAMRGQDIQLNLGQQRIDLDRDTNRINLENARYDRQLRQETNDLKRQEIQQKIDVNNQTLQQKRNDLNSGYKDSINTLTTSMGTLNDILVSPALKSITGIRGAIPNVPGSAAADVQARLDTFKSQAFLSAVTAMKGMGALSDAEGKKLDAAVGSLQNSQSEEAFRRNGKVIMDMYNQKRNDAVTKYVEQNGIQRVTAPQQSIDYLKQHPELSADFINRYGYLPPVGG
ncbi:phage DNA ejection protein [Klebsiella quasipneumoniae]|uniref:phage DNA ejection protein n=1 Tax=Klebsiella quasipneumoniae TaxID=1463165 RepID=UPI0015DBFD85|nr:phage DNA ejection protein [Klebsiella quasipneumoniae]BBQ67237.1 DNA injection protein [Klebsiella quasipneumoniae]BBR14727.1 DNA injection protein [Klebsiella quasipneumoniae]